MTGWELPETVTVAGADRKIHADYRDILDILDRLDDPDEDEETRLYVALSLFYEDFAHIEPSDWNDAVKGLMWFLNGGEEDRDGPAVKRIDWRQDRRMIVAEVNKVAGQEVRALPFCHWWTFLAWFSAIGDGQLATVVAIREKRRRGEKLEGWERTFWQENRRTVELRPRESAGERAQRQELLRLLEG